MSSSRPIQDPRGGHDYIPFFEEAIVDNVAKPEHHGGSALAEDNWNTVDKQKKRKAFTRVKE